MSDVKTAKRNKLDKPLFPLMLLGMHGDTFNFDYADLGVKIASTWTYDWRSIPLYFKKLI